MAGPGKQASDAVKGFAVLIVIVFAAVVAFKGGGSHHKAAPMSGDYDSASCSDWATADSPQQSAAALYFANEFNDPQPETDAPALVTAITTVCASYGSSETPADAAKVSIRTIYPS